MIMDFRQLESFVAIAKLKSFSKAAERLFLTQPTLSNHISRLEEELGVILLARNNKKTELTDAGKLFFASAQELISRREQAVVDLGQFEGRIEGTLEIGASSIPGQYLLPQILARFCQSYPDVVYNIHYQSSHEVISQLISQELDFGMVGSPADNSLLVYEKAADDELVAIAPPIKPFTQMESITAQQLLAYRLIMRKEGSGTRRIFEDALKTATGGKAQIKAAAYTDNTEMVNLCVMQGLGLAVTSRLAVADKAAHGQLKILPISDLELNRNCWFVYLKGRVLSPLACRFRDFVTI